MHTRYVHLLNWIGHFIVDNDDGHGAEDDEEIMMTGKQ